MLKELIQKNRSYRRFMESSRLDRGVLEGFIENARFSASTANLQPLRYRLIDSSGPCAETFDCLKWASYLSDWDGPQEGERPAGYIVVLHDTAIAIKPEYLWCDAGLAAQHILMSATEAGYGGCIIASVNRERLRSLLDIAERCTILVVIALGQPNERVVLTELDAEGSIRYYRDAEGTHFVPKRSLADLIV
ncbi:MAG TPA: nitroreductase family protein [Spirochaetia bacterium]|nr:nitroreductase family protein [Spirochaetia bacterium]